MQLLRPLSLIWDLAAGDPLCTGMAGEEIDGRAEDWEKKTMAPQRIRWEASGFYPMHGGGVTPRRSTKRGAPRLQRKPE